MIIVRRVDASEAAAYRALRLEGFRRDAAHFRVAPSDEEEQPLAATEQRLTSEFVAGAFDSGLLVGVAGLGRIPGAKLRHKALLWGMYVRPESRGRGLARRLIEYLLAHATAEGLAQVHLTVMAANLEARHLYERMGFAAYGREPCAVRLEDGCVDEILMARLLTDAAAAR